MNRQGTEVMPSTESLLINDRELLIVKLVFIEFLIASDQKLQKD